MRTTPLLFAVFVLHMIAATPALGEDERVDPRGLVIFNCSRCHAADQYYLAERSEKAWELLVKRMQSYYYDESAFSDAEARIMVKYLASHPYSDADYRPLAFPPPGPIGEGGPAGPASQPATTSAPVGPDNPPPTEAEQAAKAKLASLTVSPAKATGLAKVMGYIAAGALGLMVATGLMRRRIGVVFRKTHGVLAFIFCGALTVHAAVFLAEYGAPGVVWLWFGIIATVILLSSEFTGLLHLKNRKLFVKFHIAAGVVGLTLTAAHWVWIYI